MANLLRFDNLSRLLVKDYKKRRQSKNSAAQQSINMPDFNALPLPTNRAS